MKGSALPLLLIWVPTIAFGAWLLRAGYITARLWLADRAYRKSVAEVQALKTELGKLQAESDAMQAEVERLDAEISKLDAEIADVDAEAERFKA